MLCDGDAFKEQSNAVCCYDMNGCQLQRMPQGFDTAVYYVSMSTEGRLPKNPDCEEHLSAKKGGVLGRFRVGHLAAAVV